MGRNSSTRPRMPIGHEDFRNDRQTPKSYLQSLTVFVSTEPEGYEEEEWDSEDEYIGSGGGLEAGDGGHVEAAWNAENDDFIEGGGGDAGMRLRKRIGIDEDTTWDDVLRENGTE